MNHANVGLIERPQVVSAPIKITAPQPDPAPTSNADTIGSAAASPAATPAVDKAPPDAVPSCTVASAVPTAVQAPSSEWSVTSQWDRICDEDPPYTHEDAAREAYYVDRRRCYWYDCSVAYDCRIVASDAQTASRAFTVARTRGQR